MVGNGRWGFMFLLGMFYCFICFKNFFCFFFVIFIFFYVLCFDLLGSFVCCVYVIVELDSVLDGCNDCGFLF